MRKDYVSGGSNISLSIDSNLLDTNPLFQVWKTKSFTDNDIVLHFLILDLLQRGREMTVEEITDYLMTDYEALFDVQTVRRKCNDYAKEGMLKKEKVGKTILYSLDTSLTLWLKSNEDMLDALSFFQMAGCFGIVGNELSDQLDSCNPSFRVKHSFFVHTLEEEILFALLDAMNREVSVQLAIKGTRSQRVDFSECIPLQIFTSTRSGRRFLCAYTEKGRRFTCFRLDSVKQVTPLERAERCDVLQEKLNQNRHLLWGVSFQSRGGHHQDSLHMTLQIREPEEHYIVDRLKREGRGGKVTRIAPDTYQYEIQVFDCNEMLPWIRTFIGRILSLECTDKSLEQRFYRDLHTMYHMYQTKEDEGHGTVF